MAIYFKITNEKENHNGFQYHEGLNELVGEFNDNPNASNVPGGLYFTTAKYIHKFYKYGCNIRVVKLPENDDDFRMVYDPIEDCYRANKIILGEKFNLDDITPYVKYNITPPTTKMAIDRDYLMVVKYHVENGLDVNADKTWILRYSVENKKTRIAKYLVNNGANVHVNDEEILRIATTHNDIDFVQFLYQHANYNACDSTWASHTAAKLGNLDLLVFFEKNGANLSQEDILLNAATAGHVNIVQYLVENKKNKIKEIYVAFGRATQSGQIKVVDYLVSKGVNIHTDNESPLYLAAREGALDMVKYLVERGADINARNGDIFWTAFCLDRENVVNFFVEKGVDPQMDDNYLLSCASKKGFLKVVEYCIQNGANINTNHKIGSTGLLKMSYYYKGHATPLIWAASAGHLDVVSYLLKNGADVHASNDLALRIASGKNRLGVVKILVENGANIKSNKYEAIKVAKVSQHRELVTYLEEELNKQTAGAPAEKSILRKILEFFGLDC